MAEKVVGIIAEWNPFHRGHEDMVHSVRKAYGDPFIMAVMSGWRNLPYERFVCAAGRAGPL